MGTDGTWRGGGELVLPYRQGDAGDLGTGERAARSTSVSHKREREEWESGGQCGREMTGRNPTLHAQVQTWVQARRWLPDTPDSCVSRNLAGSPVLHQSGLAQLHVQPTKRAENCTVGGSQVRAEKPNTPLVTAESLKILCSWINLCVHKGR